MDVADYWHDQASRSWQELSSITELSTSFILIVRIRTLYFSSNTDCFPDTSPIPPFFSGDSSKENAASTAKGFISLDQAIVDVLVAKLAYLNRNKQAMGVAKFDGPAGQVEDSSLAGIRRHSRQHSIGMNVSPSTSNVGGTADTGINHRTLGNLIGTERRMSVNPISKATSREMLRISSPASQKPRYKVRTVVPRNSRDTEEPRPTTLHVPGSFRSEISVVAAEISGSTTPTLLDKAIEVHGDASDLESAPSYRESVDAVPAAEDPKRLAEVVTGSVPQPIRSIRSHPALSKDSKDEKGMTIEHKRLVRPVHNPFFRPYSSHNLALDSGRSVLTSSKDQSLISESQCFEALIEPRPSTEEDTSKAAPLQCSAIPDHFQHVSSNTANIKDDLTFIGPSTLDPTSSSQKIVSCSPINRNEVAAGENSLEHRSMTLDTPSAGSRKASLSHELLEHLSKPNKSSMGVEVNPSKTEIKNRISPLWENSAELEASKPAVEETPLKVKQLSGLESLVELHNSNAIPSTAWTKHEMMGFATEANHLRRSLSVSSSSNTGSFGDNSDVARLIQSTPAGKTTYRFPAKASSSSGMRTPSSRRPWVQHLLGRQHSPPSHEVHLTQRPSAVENDVLRKGHASMLSYRQLDTGDSFSRFMGSETTDATSSVRRPRHADPETFSKVILDLESLMREVLLIAKHVAVDKEAENAGPAVVDRSASYSRDTTYNRRTLPSNHAVPGEGVWATSDGNASLGAGSTDEYTPHSADRTNFVESAIASQDRSKSQKHQDKRLYPTSLMLHTDHSSASPDLEQEFRSVSAHARELARHLKVPDPLLESPSKALQQRDERRESVLVGKSLAAVGGLRSPSVIDFAFKARRGSAYPEVIELPVIPRKPLPSQQRANEQRSFLLRNHSSPADDFLQNTIARGNAPQVQPRSSSTQLQRPSLSQNGDVFHNIELGQASSSDDSVLSFSGQSTFIRHMTGDGGHPYQQPGAIGPGKLPAQDTITTLRSLRSPNSQENDSSGHGGAQPRPNLKNMHHFSIRGPGPPGGFSLRHSHRRAPIARDWSTTRKRFVAAVTCLNTALLGIIIGIYAGEVPAIQYAIADGNHYTILGNVVFYLGLAIPTFFFWPLPLLHGRKPYTLAALAILMPLQFPQALVVDSFRSPNSPMYRIGLLLPRSFAGVAMGFANINLQTTLLDLFGASLQSGNPHQEVVNENDVRRHGGGMGVWLGLWTWCSIGSLGVGFLIGAVIISGLNVSWGFWITIVLTAAMLLLNVVTPEVRRSPYRRSLAEVPQDGGDVSRRIARGEIMMHLYQTGPIHWWEEVIAGLVLIKRMLSQPAFVVMAVYLGWIYGQIVMVIVVSFFFV